MVTCQADATGAIEGLDRWIKNLSEMTEKKLVDMATEVQQGMQVEGTPAPEFPPPWLSPISSEPPSWDSAQQRTQFFATNGFGKGIPTTRTGTYINGWSVTSIPGGAELANRTGYAVEVGGDPISGWQSMIHRGRWPHILDVLSKVITDYFNR
jgi:hypothetical protein